MSAGGDEFEDGWGSGGGGSELTAAELGEEEKGEEDSGDCVHLEGAFVAVVAELGSGGEDAGVENGDVKPREFGGHASSEGLDAGVGEHVEGPDVDSAGAGREGADLAGGSLTGREVADGKDQTRSSQTVELEGSFIAETDVGAGNEDDLAGEGGGGVGGGVEPLFEELEEPRHRWSYPTVFGKES